jgi:hypothetical protein
MSTPLKANFTPWPACHDDLPPRLQSQCTIVEQSNAATESACLIYYSLVRQHRADSLPFVRSCLRFNLQNLTGNGTYHLAVTTSGSTAVSREAGANAPQLIIETAP